MDWWFKFDVDKLQKELERQEKPRSFGEACSEEELENKPVCAK